MTNGSKSYQTIHERYVPERKRDWQSEWYYVGGVVEHRIAIDPSSDAVTVTCVDNPVDAVFTVGGNVTGATGALTLKLNGGDDLAVAGNGAFTFPAELESGATFAVAVAAPPSGQTCAVANGSGTITANVTNVTVTCSTAPVTYTLGGTITGLTGTLILDNLTSGLPTAQRRVTISENGNWAFAYELAEGEDYDVRIIGGSAMADCAFDDDNKAVGLATADVTDIAITCN